MALEIWRLQHPELGTIEVQFGFDADFHEANESWPCEVETYLPVSVGDSFTHRATARIKNPPLRVQISQDGQLLRRLANVPSTRIPLTARPEDQRDELETLVTPAAKDKPSVQIQRNAFHEVIAVSFRHGSEVIEFDPPAGSRGEAYLKAIESSQVKRFFLTAATGLGRGGWALFILVFGGFFSKLLDWLLSFVPDWELPNWTLPTPPHIDLPVPDFPQIPLPTITLPEWDLPEAPDWLITVLDYANIWVPILIGVVAGVTALRNHKKSESKKKQWHSENSPEDT